MLARDARAAVRRLTEALEDRGVWLRSDAVAGMATLSAHLTAPEAQAVHDALGRYVDASPPDPADPRNRGSGWPTCCST